MLHACAIQPVAASARLPMLRVWAYCLYTLCSLYSPPSRIHAFRTRGLSGRPRPDRKHVVDGEPGSAHTQAHSLNSESMQCERVSTAATTTTTTIDQVQTEGSSVQSTAPALDLTQPSGSAQLGLWLDQLNRIQM